MSSTLSIDVLPTIDTLVDNNASREQIISLGAQQIRRLREDLSAGANATPEQQRKLERLQAVIGTRISLIEAAANVSDDTRKEIVAELKTLREVMDKRFILPDYAPDAPGAVRGALQFTAGSLDVGIRTLSAATRDLPPAARVGILAGAGVAAVLAIKWMWNELGVIGKTLATGVAGTMGFLGFQKLQENWTAIGGLWKSVKDTVSGWFGGGSTEQREKIRKQQNETTKLISDALDSNRTNDVDAAIGRARKAIQDELTMINPMPGQEQRKEFLQGRLKALEAREAGLKKIENQTKNTEDKMKVENQAKNAENKTNVENQAKNKEDKIKVSVEQQVIKAISDLPSNQNFIAQSVSFEADGVNIAIGTNGIFVDGLPMRIQVQQYVPPSPAILGISTPGFWSPPIAPTLEQCTRAVGGLQIVGSVDFGLFTVRNGQILGFSEIADAIRRYNAGERLREQEHTVDGKRLKIITTIG
ncbi:hypothetical protein HYW84_00535 [Candidatus Peregrinibacteria bacterium]|nr:hypothetical protein [Candidatus Peregrinibacteria bacterium]